MFCIFTFLSLPITITMSDPFLDPFAAPTAAPSTPPRMSKSRANRSPVNLRTPQSSRKSQNFFTHLNAASSKSSRTNLAPVTPDFTPQKSPRLHRKRNIESIFTTTPGPNGSHASQVNDNSFFLPTPSTVGSGRKCNINTNNRLKPVTLKFDTLLLLNEGLKFESDEEETDNFFLKPSNGGNTKFMSNLNMLKSPTKIRNNPFEDLYEPGSPTPTVTKSVIPETPHKQLINDEKIQSWHGKSLKYFDDDDDFDSILQSKTEMANPFLSTNVNSNINISKPAKSSVNYDTHLELINNKTGEKKVIKLTEHQASIKPKKLNFSSI